MLYQDSDLGSYIRSLDKQLGELHFPRCRYHVDLISSLGVYVLYGLLGRGFQKTTKSNFRRIFRLKQKFSRKPRISADFGKLLEVVYSMSSSIVNGLFFGVFIWLNNGNIVLGDQAAHQPTLHLLQFGYFGLYNLFFAAPILITHLQLFLSFLWRNKMKFLLLCVVFSYLQLDPIVRVHKAL